MIFILFLSFGNFYSGEFMEMGVGARPLGMGNAVVGLANDPTTFYWNPAGLTQLLSPELFVMYSEDFDGEVSTSTASFSYPAKSYTLALSMYLLQVPSIPLTDTTEGGIVVDTGFVNANDFIGYLSYASSFTLCNVGINVKYISRNWGSIGNGYGFQTDIGVLSKYRNISYGFNIVNLVGTPVSFSLPDTVIKYNFSPIIKSGIALSEQVADATFSICMGFDTFLEKRVCEFTELRMDTHLGVEYFWRNRFALRAGRDRGIFSIGCGLLYEPIKLDYALQFHPELGSIRRLSGSIVF